MPLGLIGKKLGQTRVYEPNGTLLPVTVVLAGPNRVLQVKTTQTDGYDAVQLAFGDQRPQRLAKGQLGHLVKYGAVSAEEVQKARPKPDKKTDRKEEKKIVGPKPLNAVAKIKEFRNFSKAVKAGELLNVDLFAPGDFVDAIGVTKGRGFEGVVKRHGFRGGDSTHGAKGWHRRSGAIGQRLFPGTVMRGMKMPGHMGHVRRTVQNLEVIQVRPEEHVLLIKGAIPGANGDYVIIREAKKMPKGTVKKKAAEQPKGKGGKAPKPEPKAPAKK